MKMAKEANFLRHGKEATTMYTILTDSCSDLNPQILRQFDRVAVLPMSYTLAGETSTKPFDDAKTVHAYYDRLRAGETCTTAQISPDTFCEAFRAFAKQGEPVLGILFSSALSGTYNAACLARSMVLEEYPDAVIELVDSLAASAGEGLLVYDALKNREAGMSLEDNAQWVRDNALHLVHWFTVDDLHFLKRGGRCSPSAAFFGSMLSIKPVLHVDNEGRLIARQKVRGRQQALRALAAKYGELSDEQDQMIFISHGDCEEDALTVKRHLVESFGCDPKKIVLSVIGPVIGSHSGPGTVALFFHGKDRG